jgi:hypothetical protein
VSRIFKIERSRYASWRFGITSGDDEDYPGCRLNFSAPGWWGTLRLPPIIRPHRTKVFPDSWDAATISRLGRNWYWDTDAREYSISYSEGYLHLHYGRQSNDSQTDKSWCKELPWLACTFVRHSLLNLQGLKLCDLPQGRISAKWEETERLRASQPKAYFLFRDYDGEQIKVCCDVEEREWHRGRGTFSWLRWFSKPLIRRSLNLNFSAEVGKKKGSWKGGTLGHGTKIEAGESASAAFIRYCAEQKLEFIGPCDAWPEAPNPARKPEAAA